MKHAKTVKGQPRRYASSELVHRLYKSFPPDHFGQAEMNVSNTLSNKSSTAWLCAEDQILDHSILRNRFLIFVLNDK